MTPTRITAQGCEIPQAIRDQAEALAARWPRYDPDTMGVSFVFQTEGRTFTAEAIVSRRRRQPVVARGQGPDFRIAMDQLDGHVKRLLRKDRAKRKEYRTS